MSIFKSLERQVKYLGFSTLSQFSEYIKIAEQYMWLYANSFEHGLSRALTHSNFNNRILIYQTWPDLIRDNNNLGINSKLNATE